MCKAKTVAGQTLALPGGIRLALPGSFSRAFEGLIYIASHVRGKAKKETKKENDGFLCQGRRKVVVAHRVQSDPVEFMMVWHRGDEGNTV